MTQTGRPLDAAQPGDDAVGGQLRIEGVGEGAVLDERSGVEQQPQPLAGEELALLGVLGVVARSAAPVHALQRPGHARLGALVSVGGSWPDSVLGFHAGAPPVLTSP